MSRRKRPARSGPAPRANREGADRASDEGVRRPRAAAILIGALLVVAVSIAGWLAGRGSAPRVAVDSLAALDPTEAYRQGYELLKARQAYESLPYFRRAIAGRPDDWRLRVNAAVAMSDAALEARSVRGSIRLKTASSFERIALMREALAQQDRAEALATSPGDRARAIAARAHVLVVWGFPRDALAEFRRAGTLDPQWASLASDLEAQLRDPTMPASESGGSGAGQD